MSLAEYRFLVEVPSGCWIWTGRLDKDGYGKVNRSDMAHRLMYEAHVGAIPPGLQIDHLCRQKLCVNPAHLEPVTLAENRRRAEEVRTHCSRGHSLTDEANVRWSGNWRICRACAGIRKAASRARRRAAT